MSALRRKNINNASAAMPSNTLARVANQFRGKYDIRNKRTLDARGASESADRFSGVIVASETRPGEFLTGG